MRDSDAPEPDPFSRPGEAGEPAPGSPPVATWGRRHQDRWMESWISSTRELARLKYSHRMLDAVIDEIDGRDIRIGEHWLTDYSSSNYLGLDLDEGIIDAVPEYLARWGTHPSWPRLLGSPVLYEEIESRLTELLGVEDTLVLPTIAQIHSSAIPVLAAAGTVFLDSGAHETIVDGCAVAEARGTAIRPFSHGDLDELATQLHSVWRRPGMICVEGVNGMTGNFARIAALAALARAHDVLLYVDDAHGFGVLGERAEGEWCPYGIRGNGIVRHAGESYENVVVAGDFAHAYSSPLAFIACPTPIKQLLKTAASPYLYCGPAPVAALATVLEGLRVNDARGNRLRARVHRLTRRVTDRVAQLGLVTPSGGEFPIIQLPVADPAAVGQVGDLLFDAGVYATMAVHPLAPREHVGFRFQLTAANTDGQVDHLLLVLGGAAERFKIRRAPAD